MNKLIKPFVLFFVMTLSFGASAQQGDSGKKREQLPFDRAKAVKQIKTPGLEVKKGPSEVVKSEKKIVNHSIADSKRARALASE